MDDARTLAAVRRRRLLARRDAGRLLTRQRLARAADMPAVARRASASINGFVAAWTEQADDERLDAMIDTMWRNA